MASWVMPKWLFESRKEKHLIYFGQDHFNDLYLHSQRDRCNAPCCEKCFPRESDHWYASDASREVMDEAFMQTAMLAARIVRADRVTKRLREESNPDAGVLPIPTWRFLLGWF